jgi:D-3-phosphoglycerate dehydrogenase
MKILISEANGYSLTALDIYRQFGEVIESNGDFNHIESIIEEVDVLVVKLKFTWNEAIIARAKRLKFIVTSTTGLNHIKLPTNSKIRIISLKGETEFLNTITPTAELTWALILNLFRNIPEAINSVKNRNWQRNQFIGKELSGSRLGIIGYGRLGRMVARFGVAFNMNVVVYDNDTSNFREVEFGISFKSLEETLSLSDIVSIHIPLNEDNINYLDKEKLSLLKRGSVVVNTSRGEVIDEHALLEMVDNGHLAGIGLDVLADEVSQVPNWEKSNPIINSRYFGSKVLVTPHIGGACSTSMERTEIFVAQKTETLLREEMC